MKRPLKRRIRALKSKAVKAVTRGHGSKSYRLKLQAARIEELADAVKRLGDAPSREGGAVAVATLFSSPANDARECAQ